MDEVTVGIHSRLARDGASDIDLLHAFPLPLGGLRSGCTPAITPDPKQPKQELRW